MTTVSEERIAELSMLVAEGLQDVGLKLATAESCTGGWVSQCLTSLSGSSQWFDSGFVTYSNMAKQSMLGVPAELFESAEDGLGAVSKETVVAMAEGALNYSLADIAVSISGIAGPEGGSIGKPVGTVWIGVAQDGKNSAASRHQFLGDRYAVRIQAVEAALKAILNALGVAALD